jgi:hypothetical protein
MAGGKNEIGICGFKDLETTGFYVELSGVSTVFPSSLYESSTLILRAEKLRE